MILPSLLEYSTEQIIEKLTIIRDNMMRFREITLQESDIHIHLDVVLKQFAKDRHVMKSIYPSTSLGIITSYFETHKVYLTVHLMGTELDMADQYEYWNNVVLPKNVDIILYVPPSVFEYWSGMVTRRNIERAWNCRVGVWLDLDEWQEYDQLTEYVLLMTVYAGKSGQKRLDETKLHVQDFVQLFPHTQFIVDGGWAVDEENEFKENIKVEIVSHSSFWKAIKMN